MRKALLPCFLLGLSALLTLPLLADDDNAQKDKAKKRRPDPTARVFLLPDGVELDADQKEKLEALKKKYGPKIAELQQKQAGILTQEQRQARAAAVKEARDAGKKGKDLREAVDAAVDLAEDQKKMMGEIQAAQREVFQEARKEFLGLLTEEQRAKVQPIGNAKGKAKTNAE